jgi:hypothetical protein
VPRSVIEQKCAPYLQRGKPARLARLFNEDDHTIVGHRRYTRASIRAVPGEEPDGPPMVLDAARLHAQG